MAKHDILQLLFTLELKASFVLVLGLTGESDFGVCYYNFMCFNAAVRGAEVVSPGTQVSVARPT